jgi:sugar phosphate isomerase/epimerase
MTRVGLQLWTIRDECERDLAGTLARVGAMGYDGVELFSLHGLNAVDVRGLLDDTGLIAIGRHTPLEHDAAELAAELAILGTDRAAIAWIDPDALDPEPVRAAAERAREAGVRLGFHNHWSEPVGEPSFLDRLRELPAELLWLELDLGWVWHAGVDPVRELERSAGRCPLVHVKDFASRDGRDDVPVGSGAVGYDAVLPAAVAAGAEWLIVEEDEVGDEPFAAIEESLRFVREAVSC